MEFSDQNFTITRSLDILGPDHWRSALKNSLRSSSQLATFFQRPFPSTSYFPFVPLKLAEKIKEQGPNGPLALQFLPSLGEVDPLEEKGGYDDPIGDKINAKGGQLIHRYPNRVLFTPTVVCPVQCRYCFRKNELNQRDEIFSSDFTKTLDYLEGHEEIEEIIFTGGDPLMLDETRLDFYLEQFSTIHHIKYIRFHTRMPLIIPERITPQWEELLNKFKHRFFINLVLHTNHISEWDADLLWRLTHFTPKGIGLLTQTVLLKGVNDQVDTLKELFYFLNQNGIRPYYLHHPDKVRGGMHFYLPLPTGEAIFKKLKKSIPGWMLPQYVVDTPWGGGKVSAWGPGAINGKISDLNNSWQTY